MSFPSELTSLKRWVCWRLVPDKDGEKPRKVPLNALTGAGAKSNDPSTWVDYQTARDAADQYGYNGVGFMFLKGDGYVGIDIDHCYDPASGTFNETAKAIMARQNTYMEFSPSGDGVHLYYKGVKPKGSSKNTESGVEMYDSVRYFTVTEKQVPGSLDNVAEALPDTLQWIYDTFLSKKKAGGRKKKRAAGEKLSDEEVLEKAQGAQNGEDFTALWEGRWQEKYPSQSEADMALCMKLAFWTARDKEQMDRLFRQSGLFREKWDARHHADGATYGEETLERANAHTENVYSCGGDSPIIEYEGRYFRLKGEAMYPLTNFVIVPGEMICAEGDVQMTGDFVTVNGESYHMTFMTTELSNPQRFKTLLSSNTIALGWFGGEGELELFKTYISTLGWQRKTGVKAMGIYEFEGKRVFATCDRSIDAGGEIAEGLVQLEKYQSIRSDILDRDLPDAESLQEIGKWLLAYNEPAKTAAILSWTAGCFLKPHLRAENIKFPHLFLIGEAGSGKSTTLERVILPVFSTERVTAATQVTPFTLMKESASSNLVPMPLDEFKPSKIDKLKINALYNHFRDTYDGHDGVRGRADQSVVTYQLLAPLVVAGEESADEAAIRERSIELLFSKKDLKRPEYRMAFNRIGMNRKLLGDFGRTLLKAALETSSSETAAWYMEGLGKVQGELPSRVISNIACCWCGLKLLEKVCAGYRMQWDSVFPIPMEGCLRYLEYGTNEYLLDGGTHNKSIVEQTFEVMSRMGLSPKTDYQFSADGSTLYIRLAQIYDQYTKYRRDYAVTGEVLPYAQFRKQLTHSDLLLQAAVQRRFDGMNSRCFAIDYALLKQRCEVEEFENTEEVRPLT